MRLAMDEALDLLRSRGSLIPERSSRKGTGMPEIEAKKDTLTATLRKWAFASDELTRKQRKWLAFGLVAAFLTALFKSMDNVTVRHLITSDDRVTGAFAYLIIGSLAVTVSGFALAPFFARTLDAKFRGLVVRNARIHAHAATAASLAACSTFFGLLAYQTGDPSALVALSGAVLIYIALYDSLKYPGLFSRIRLPVAIAVMGSGMAAFTGSVNTTLASVALMLVFSNGFSAASEIVEQRGMENRDGSKNCAISLMLWRFLYMAAASIVLAFAVSAFRGRESELLATIGRSVSALPFVVATMMVVFFAIGIKMVIKSAELLTATLLTISLQVVFAYPITIVGELVSPGLFGGLPNSWVVWIVRISGASLLIWGFLVVKKYDTEFRKKAEKELAACVSATAINIPCRARRETARSHLYADLHTDARMALHGSDARFHAARQGRTTLRLSRRDAVRRT